MSSEEKRKLLEGMGLSGDVSERLSRDDLKTHAQASAEEKSRRLGELAAALAPYDSLRSSLRKEKIDRSEIVDEKFVRRLLKEREERLRPTFSYRPFALDSLAHCRPEGPGESSARERPDPSIMPETLVGGGFSPIHRFPELEQMILEVTPEEREKLVNSMLAHFATLVGMGLVRAGRVGEDSTEGEEKVGKEGTED